MEYHLELFGKHNNSENMRPRTISKLFSRLILTCGFVMVIYSAYSRGKFPIYDYGTYDRTEDKIKYETILKLTNCEYRPMDTRIEQRSRFWVLKNYIKAKKRFKCYESITLTTNADFRFLDNLIPLVKRWKGPISVALYAPGDDFYRTLDSIAYLRNCETVLIKEYVTFHLFFDFEYTPHKVNSSSLQKAYKDTFSCSKQPPYLTYDLNKTYKVQNKLTYPINVARNIAREAAQTHYIFPSDIELYTTHDFIKKFKDMLVKNTTLITDPRPKVFVLPIFEVLSTANVPGSKTELQNMFKNNTAFLFHQNLCAICHVVPKYKEWMAQEEREDLNVFAVGKRLKHHRYWEAFYVGTHADPIFDERLTWEGQSNKMAQGFSLCLLDYDYLVLDNAFLIHKPGVKHEKEQIKKYRKNIAETNYIVRHHIKPELEAIYGKREGCVLR